MIGYRSSEAQGLERGVELLVPRSRCLFQAIEQFVQLPDHVFALPKSLWLLHEDLLLERSIKERCLHIHLQLEVVHRGKSEGEPDGLELGTGATVSSHSIPGCWLNPRATSQALYRSIDPSDSLFTLKTHSLVTTRPLVTV